MTNDASAILTWWMALFTIGLINLPLTVMIFKKMPDLGYGIGKIFGSAIISYLVFLFTVTHIFVFGRNVILFVLIILLTFNLGLIYYKKDLTPLILSKIKLFVFQEILFTSGYLFWTMVRGYQPDINGLEKFMDFGFVNATLKSKFLPPNDMWYAGGTINYYWYGHYLTALLTKFTNLPSAITYNLMLATIMGNSLSAIFSIVTAAISSLSPDYKKRAYLAGLISAILVIFAGNFHSPIYLLKDGVNKYWYPDATRFIGYNPETNDKTIHEFPLYSFVVADLHAHLINLPFVLLFLAIMWIYSLQTRRREIFKITVLGGFILGLMFMTSTWDFGNYLLASGFIFLLINFHKTKDFFPIVWNTALNCLIILLVGVLTALPFILNFTSIAQGIDFVKAHTPLWQLGVLWGFPAVLTLIFIPTIVKAKKATVGDYYILAILIASWCLIFIPEVIYVKDIYAASHHRANTMFKLTYQAFVMFYLTSGYIVVRSLSVVHKFILKITVGVFFIIIFSSILYYPLLAIKSYYGNLVNYRGLRGDAWAKTSHPDEYQAIEWIRMNITDQPVILEAPGDSYTEYNLISSYTGLPTVSGWYVHEWLWRGTPEIPQTRVNDISVIYTSSDIDITRQLLDRYKVKFVIIGPEERTKYPSINEAKFSQIGMRVFTTGGLSIYQLDSRNSYSQ